MYRVHQIPHSTNVERLAMALACKRLSVDWVDHDPADRSALRTLSGQDLVPVMETGDGQILHDSPVILRWLEAQHPEPPLWPADPAAAARADVLIDWFNRVWKLAPNAIADTRDGLRDATPGDLASWAADLRESRMRFERLLSGSPWLTGDRFGIADVVIYPFMRFAGGSPHADDPYTFHAVLVEHLALGDDTPRLADWIARAGVQARQDRDLASAARP